MKKYSIKKFSKAFDLIIVIFSITCFCYANILLNYIDNKAHAITFITFSEMQDIRGGCEGVGLCYEITSCIYEGETCNILGEDVCGQGQPTDCDEGVEVDICYCPNQQKTVSGPSCAAP